MKKIKNYLLLLISLFAFSNLFSQTNDFKQFEKEFKSYYLNSDGESIEGNVNSIVTFNYNNKPYIKVVMMFDVPTSTIFYIKNDWVTQNIKNVGNVLINVVRDINDNSEYKFIIGKNFEFVSLIDITNNDIIVINKSKLKKEKKKKRKNQNQY